MKREFHAPFCESGGARFPSATHQLVGEYKNVGSDYQPQGRPLDVNVHDFIDKELGKAIPYGVYDIGANAGCVSVGIDHDTAEFAVNAIRRWLAAMGREKYPTCDRLMITADGGGSNGSRVRLWKVSGADPRAVSCRRLEPGRRVAGSLALRARRDDSKWGRSSGGQLPAA